MGDDEGDGFARMPPLSLRGRHGPAQAIRGRAGHAQHGRADVHGLAQGDLPLAAETGGRGGAEIRVALLARTIPATSPPLDPGVCAAFALPALCAVRDDGYELEI